MTVGGRFHYHSDHKQLYTIRVIMNPTAHSHFLIIHYTFYIINYYVRLTPPKKLVR